MVGVAGKSKGCHTCRRRKIRCDQERPACSQCLKSGRSCEGYEKARVFLNTFSDLVQPQTGRVQSSSSGPARNDPERLDSRRRAIVAPTAHPDRDQEVTGAAGGHPWLKQPGLQPAVPSLIGLEHIQPDQALRDFLDCSLPTGAKQDVPLAYLYWVLTLSKDVPCLTLAASALSYGWMGHVESAPTVVSTARSYYVGALQHLHKALSDDPATQSDAILATMECLALYEIFEFGTEAASGWLAHLSGVEALIKSRGPQMHSAGGSHKMFKFFRTIGIFKAIIGRKATFLANSEWINIPWSYYYRKNSFHRYLDFAAEIPGLLERVDTLTQSTTTIPDPETINILLSDINDLLSRISTWLANSSVKLPAGPPHISPPRRAVTPTTDHPSSPQQYILSPRAWQQSSGFLKPAIRHNYPSRSPQSLGVPFDTLQSARLMHGLWSVQLTLYTSIYSSPLLQRTLDHHYHHQHHETQDPYFTSTSTDNPFSFTYTDDNNNNNDDSSQNHPFPLLSRTTATGLADKIALWSDFCGQNAWQSFGPVLAVFTLRTVVEWYAIDMEDEEARWDGADSGVGTDKEKGKGKRAEWRYSRQAQVDKCIELLGLMPGADQVGVS